MDQGWFTLSTCGALLVSWAGCPQHLESEIEPTIDIGGRSVAHDENDAKFMRIDHVSLDGKVVMRSRARLV